MQIQEGTHSSAENAQTGGEPAGAPRDPVGDPAAHSKSMETVKTQRLIFIFAASPR